MQIRNATVNDAADIAKIHIKTWQTAYAGILPTEFLSKLNKDLSDRTKRWENTLRNPDVSNKTFVALESDKMVGFCTGGKSRHPEHPHDCELGAIYILKEFQNRGLGKKLIDALIKKFIEVGFKSMLVWVLEANPSRIFYESIGGKYLSKKQIEIDGKNYTEVSYEWPDISSLSFVNM